MMTARVPALAASLVLLAGSAAAQVEGTDDPQCEVKGVNGMVTLLLCPTGLSMEAMAAEGVTACDGRMPCGAWIWTDEAFLPSEAPAAHDQLGQEAITRAVGIWVNESSEFISLQRETLN